MGKFEDWMDEMEADLGVDYREDIGIECGSTPLSKEDQWMETELFEIHKMLEAFYSRLNDAKLVGFQQDALKTALSVLAYDLDGIRFMA